VNATDPDDDANSAAKGLSSAGDDAIDQALRMKPRFGEPCNGCGFCCIQEPCDLAREFLDCRIGPCRALEYEDGRTYCGLLRRPIHYIAGIADNPALSGPLQARIAFTLAIGSGCDALS